MWNKYNRRNIKLGSLQCEYEKVKTYRSGKILVALVHIPIVQTWGMVIERKGKRTITKVGYSEHGARSLYGKTIKNIENGVEIREKRFI